jgi:hypothetical protein
MAGRPDTWYPVVWQRKTSACTCIPVTIEVSVCPYLKIIARFSVLSLVRLVVTGGPPIAAEPTRTPLWPSGKPRQDGVRTARFN